MKIQFMCVLRSFKFSRTDIATLNTHRNGVFKRITFVLFSASVARAEVKSLQFDLHRGDAVKVQGPWVDYDLSSGDTLRIGSVELSQKKFFVRTRGQEILVSWPRPMAEEGTIEMITRGGQSIWYKDFKKQDSVRNPKSTQALLNIDINRDYVPLKKLKDHFRFCVIRREEKDASMGLQRICTSWLGAGLRDGVLAIGYVSTAAISPKVFLQGKQTELKATTSVDSGEFVRFLAELSTGESFEFASPAPAVEFDDVTAVPQSKNIRVTGHGPHPLSITGYDAEATKDFEWEKRLSMEATIRDTRKVWISILPEAQSDVYYYGQGGGIFLFKIAFNAIPQPENRVQIVRPFRYLYSDKMVFEILKKPSQTITSTEGDLLVTSDTSAEWTYLAGETDVPHRSYFTVEEDGKKFPVYHEMTRYRSNELSPRISVVYSGRDLFFLGEFAFSHWFDSLLWMKNYWISRERWGVTARYFQSFTDISAGGDGSSKLALKVASADVRYRLKPGVWGREETLGLIGAFQDVTIGETQAGMLGAGAFWARSMPKAVDEIFNVFSIFRYPKWVDMEFLYYSIPTLSGIKLGTNYALNFHGKVMWTPKYFGEAGFGVKSYSLTDETRLQRVGLTAFYGTIGIGMMF